MADSQIPVAAGARDSKESRALVVSGAVWLAAILWLYGRVFVTLARDWNANENYSHGWLVVPIAAALAWQQRERLRRTPMTPAPSGLVLILASLALFVAGSLGAEIFTTRASLIGVLAGTIAFVFGWRHLRLVAFPVAFLLFMIPLPSIVFDRLTQSLQLVASDLGERLLRAADFAVIRDGNVLTLSSITLQVTDACSGIRSLVSLLMMTSLVGYLFEPAAWRKLAVTSSAIPLAIVLNGGRIAFTGVAASRFGPELARGFLHELSGWVVFVVALGAVWLLHLMLGARDDGAPAVSRNLVEAA